tara:strand:+ start:2068 stop:2940 length:873 start_codon:yes stop_codon:yes gene_type:complete
MSENKSIIDLATASMGGEAPKPKSQDPMPEGIPENFKPAQVRGNAPSEEADPKNILADLLKNVQDKIAWVDVDIPSRGFANKGVGTVQLRPFTFEDEKILRAISKVSEGTAIVNKLIQRCLKGIDYPDLLIVDKNFILYKLRAMSYGEDYKIQATCPECDYESHLTVGLNDLPVNYAESIEDLQGTLILPDSGVEVQLHILTTKDEGLLEKVSEITNNLWRFIKTINGHSGRSVTQGFVAGTTAKDISTIRNAIFNDLIGMQTLVNFVCRECDHHSALDLPINESFFDAS